MRQHLQMETGKKYILLEEADRKYWENPTEHALMKEADNSRIPFTIFSRINGKLMMLLDDDLQHAIALGQKMLESGVRVFNDQKELTDWAKSK